ncbi:hypothetical protein G4B88_005763 [Cannabis sativa]|uniref:DUF4283 domain-containing protein n=1 Tax=Cannabis sativa TaxID=3483 RepID=A0A7J6GRK4_CANSA|nr:hypothetical protein G4B88_005763 [Cannabis sativa]
MTMFGPFRFVFVFPNMRLSSWGVIFLVWFGWFTSVALVCDCSRLCRVWLLVLVMASLSSLVDLSLESVSIIPLEEEEEPTVSYEGPLIDEAEVDTRWSIMGRFFTGTPIDFMAMQNLMAMLWKPGMGMYVKELGGNKYIFQFYHEIDIQRVMDRSPWTFKNAPLIFEQLKPGDVSRESGVPSSSNVGGTMVAEPKQSTMSAGPDCQGSGVLSTRLPRIMERIVGLFFLQLF